MDLSVIIVNFNTSEKLRMTLRSVFSSRTKYDFEVFVVDNASQDGSMEMVRKDFPRAKQIANQKNLGFSKANNIALRLAQGRYLLLLNSDVEVMPDTFQKMIDYMEHNPEVGISGPRVEKPDGSLDLACRRSFPNPASSLFRLTGLSLLFPRSKYSSYNLTYLPEDQILEVDSVMGAFMLVTREVMEKIGFLDEDYFMYGEDIDYCYRAKQAGYKIRYVPITTVIHHKGSSSRRSPTRALYEFHRAMGIFYDKHYRQKYNFLVHFLVKLGIWLRFIMKYIQNFFRKEKIVSK